MYLCVYCAASNTVPTEFFQAARAVGAGMAARSWPLVYGGGSVGLMGAVAEAVQEAGGRVIGIIPQALLDREVGYLRADELIVTQTLRERKQHMEDRADAFVALAGGFGTLEELLEILTLRQLGYHDKPIIILNTAGFYDSLLAQFEQLYALGFTNQRYRRLYHVVREVDEIFTVLEAPAT